MLKKRHDDKFNERYSTGRELSYGIVLAIGLNCLHNASRCDGEKSIESGQQESKSASRRMTSRLV